MTASMALFWVLLTSVLAIGSAYYARTQGRSDAIIVLYVTLVLFATLAASKIIGFDFGFTVFYASPVVLVFAITFLLTDIVNERFGRRETQRMVLLASLAQIVMIPFSYMVLVAAPAPFFTNQAAFEAIFGTVPRIVAAGIIAFTVSELFDAYVFQWFKEATSGKHLWMRNAFSSAPSMALDSIIFATIAFYGIIPILPLIVGLTAIKWVIAVVDIPFMYAARAVLGKNT